MSADTTPRILLVLTSQSTLGDTGEPTGFWYDEMAAPYYRFTDGGAEVTLASPDGGQPPMDPMSKEDDFVTDDTERFDKDDEAQRALAATTRLDGLTADQFDSVFYAGGHGPMWDLAEDPVSINLIETFWGTGKPVATTCHAPAVLRHVTEQGGDPLVRGKRVTGFANSEEAAVQRTDAVPFLLEDELKRLGGEYSKADDWEAYVVEDGRLITGQNPKSAGPVAERLLAQLSACGAEHGAPQA